MNEMGRSRTINDPNEESRPRPSLLTTRGWLAFTKLRRITRKTKLLCRFHELQNFFLSNPLLILFATIGFGEGGRGGCIYFRTLKGIVGVF